MIEFFQNLAGCDAADRILANNGDPGIMRPWIGKDGRSYVVVNDRGTRKVMLANTPATLSRDAWFQFDSAVVRALRERLRAYADIRAAGLTYNLPAGMAHTMLQYQTMGDISAATVSMDPVRRSERDRPETDVVNLPLPIIHKDFSFSAREILVSRQGQWALDTTTAEMAARKVGEEIEKMTVGTVSPFTYGGASIYGYINFPYRATKTDMTAPTGSNGSTVVNEVLALRQLLIDDKHFGPYMLYVNSQWAQYLDNDFSTSKGDNTLRSRILAIEDIRGIRTLDHLPTTKWHMVLVEMSTETVRAINGMEVQTVQWDTDGGMMKHFKVMAMQIPQLRADTAGNSGVAHGTVGAYP